MATRFVAASAVAPFIFLQPLAGVLAGAWVLEERLTPQALVGGAVIALGLATLLKVNQPAAVVPTWLTNPITIPPIYAFTYYLGSVFWPGPKLAFVTQSIRDAAHEISTLDFLSIREQLAVFVGLGVDVFAPMWIGGLILGCVMAAIAYPLTLWMVVDLRERRVRLRDRRRERRRHKPAN